MISQDDIDQFEESSNKELDRLLVARIKYKASKSTEAADFVSHVEESLLALIEKTCREKWMCQWASTHPVSAILFLNKIHQQLDEDKFLRSVTKTIQTSDVYKILQDEHPKKCSKFLSIEPLSKSDLRTLTVLDIFNSQRQGRRENEPFFIGNQFRAVAGHFETLPQVWDVRDEVRRRLVSQALIHHDFKTRAASRSIGCKSDGALAGNVRALFGTTDYKRETIEPVIRGWKPAENHPFQHIIEDMAVLKTLPDVEKRLQEFYTTLLMKAGEKCQFVKVRMANSLDINEGTVNSLLSSLELEDWYKESHKEFLVKTCETVGYNFSQVATLLNVDVRYVAQQLASYEIEKPNADIQPDPYWPR